MGEALRLKHCDGRISAQKAQVDQEIAELGRQVARYTSMADKPAAADKDTALSALLVNQLIERVTVNGPDDVFIDIAFESGFERVMEVPGNEQRPDPLCDRPLHPPLHRGQQGGQFQH